MYIFCEHSTSELSQLSLSILFLLLEYFNMLFHLSYQIIIFGLFANKCLFEQIAYGHHYGLQR
jgi:hypothetical protein